MKQLFFVFFLVLATAKGQAKAFHVEVGSKSALLMNAETGTILYEKNAHLPSYPASITKIATALYALERKGNFLDEPVVAFQECLGVATHAQKLRNPTLHPSYRLEPDGTSMGIKLLETLTFKDLLYGLMLASGNDAANVIAQHVSGSVPKFMDELNRYLRQKNITETFFNNPHGLHHEEHRTTAYDMGKIACEALKKPVFQEIVKALRYDRPQTNKQPPSVLVQHNQLLKRGPYFYSYACGIKTGYHSKAGYTLVAAAKKDDRILVAVILGAPDLKQRYKDAITLFETAFAEQKVSRLLFTKEHEQFSYLFKGAKKIAKGVLAEDFQLTYYPSEEPEFKAFLHWLPLAAPIQKGQRLGEIQLVTKEGRILKTAPLYAKEQVEATLSFSLKKSLNGFGFFIVQFKTYFLLGIGLIFIGLLFLYAQKAAQKNR
jgi:D-alanyl-D-alanine carboxypeptidase (penicillin-binding protein 5/6)